MWRKDDLMACSCKHNEREIKQIRNIFPDLWSDIYWYQKVFLNLLSKAQNTKRRLVTLIPRQRTCIQCGKNFRDRQYYYIHSRYSGKTMIESAKLIRYMCCSDECFSAAWEKMLDLI